MSDTFDAVCDLTRNGHRFYVMGYDSLHSLTVFQLHMRYSGVVTIYRGRVRVRMVNTTIKFTPYQVMWFNYWVHYFTVFNVGNMDYGCSINRQGWRISSSRIRYGDIDITPYCDFNMRNGNISISNAREKINCTSYEFCKLLAVSIVLSPHMDELIY